MYRYLEILTNKQELEYLLKLIEKDKENCKDELEDANRNLRIEVSTMIDKFNN